jgi:methylenetetrahydrofolate reductase (NADPH)
MMSKPATSLQERIVSGNPLLLAEISPPRSADPAPLRETAKRYLGKVHALGISDNRDRLSMAALAAAALVAAEGIEPIMHVTTRDRNRIALVSEALGAQALGIRNVLCTSGSHQTLGQFRAAKNVYDVDSIQLLQTYARLAEDCAPLNESGIAGAGPFCLGGVASPDADPLELQVSRLLKKTAAGAAFLITQPVFDLERFDAWWKEVTRRGIHEKVAILAGVQPLGEAHLSASGATAGLSSSAENTVGQANRGTRHRIPTAVIERITAKKDRAARRAAAIEIALETIGKLSQHKGLRGFAICGDGDSDAAFEIVEKSGLGSK